jgi:alkanesulfonate monooxygenase SsuD/methylene tetrahydromethanopterin reductase-like flavin-dependent oxidoreductase (luciferase family)
MPVRDRIPIYLAGVREGMIRTAAQVADGLLGHPIYSLRWIQDVVLPSLARGLAESGRKREEFHLCLAVCCAVGNDVAEAKRAAAATIAFYATVNTYEPLFLEFPTEVKAIQAAVLRRDTESMIAAVSDEMIETFAVVGTPEEARHKLAPYAALADSICLTPPDQLVAPEEAAAYREALVAVFGR